MSYSTVIAHLYSSTRINLQNWQSIEQALRADRRGDLSTQSDLPRRIKQGLRDAEKLHRDAERELFDVFDIMTSNLVHYKAIGFTAKNRRAYLLKRADFHQTIANRPDLDPDHAEMHLRIAEQLRDIANKPRRATL